MSLRITETTYTNFGPFEHETFDFGVEGLTVVEGLIKGMVGCDSNGAGKSFLFDGVAWALFGRCIRDKYKGDDVVRLGSSGGCSVEVRLEDETRKIEVARYRKHPVHKDDVILRINGKNVTRGTSTATTLCIEDVVGMSFTAFCNSVAFGVREDVKSFFAASDTDRKEVLERILGLMIFTSAEKVARKRVAALIETHAKAKHEVETQQAILTEREAMLFDLTHSEDVEEVDLQLSLRRLTAKRLRQRVAREQGVLADLRDVEAKELAAYEEREAVYKLALTRYEEKRTSLEKDRRKVERALAEQQGARKVEEQRLAKFKKLAGKACPTCDQPVTEAWFEKVRLVVDTMLGDIDDSIKNLFEQVKQVEAQFTAGLGTKPTPIAVPESLQQAADAVRAKEQVLVSVEKSLATEEARVEEMQASRQMMEGKAEALRLQIEQVHVIVEAREAVVADAEAQMKALEFWIQGFGNQGLKSFLIEAEIPEINQRATRYAQQLLGKGAVVRLSATSKLKTKDLTREKLEVEGSIPGLTQSYAGASTGQRKRMDLSLLLAFRDIVSRRDAKAFRQLLADEVFDGLDKTGAECVVALLKEIAKDCPVVLVTHDSRIKPVADRLVTIVHDGTRATIHVQ